MRTSPRLLSLALLALLTTGCSEGPAPAPTSADGVRVAVAPLSLPGLSEVCFDLRVTNAADGAGEVVWSRGTPGLNAGTPDGDALCSSRYGSGAGGDLTYIGPCDADGQEDADPAGERTNSVTIWFDGLYDEGGAYLDPAGASGWQNPCVDAAGDEVGCTLNVLCEENADALVQFDFTVMRDADQGFFDVAVNFDDIFCSAKVDCAYPATQSSPARPIELVFDPNTNERVQTVVWAFACTDGDPGGPAQDATHLYMDDLVLDCVDAQGAHTLHTVPAAAGPGNLYSLTDPAPAPLVQAMVFEGRELIQNAGADADKLYWNVALGLDMAFFQPATGTAPSCTLVTKATASKGPFTAGTTPPNASYPYVAVNVPINNGNFVTCTQHPLNGTGTNSGVATDYTDVAPGGAGFASATFSNAAAPTGNGITSTSIDTAPPDLPPTEPCAPSPCLHGTCAVVGASFTCICEPGWDGVTCAEDLDECTAPSPCFEGVACIDEPAPLTGYRCDECPMGYDGDGVTCAIIGLPTDDPYLAYTTAAWDAYPAHDLSALVGDSRWYFPQTWSTSGAWCLDDSTERTTSAEVSANASERVIYQDRLTGAEVWVLARGPQREDVVYTNERRFNADGSLIRVGTAASTNQVRRTDGGFVGLGAQVLQVPAQITWDPDEPSAYLYDHSPRAQDRSPTEQGALSADTRATARYQQYVADQATPPTTSNLLFQFPSETNNWYRELTHDLSLLAFANVPLSGPPSATISLFAADPAAPTNAFPATPTKVFELRSRSSDPSLDRFGTFDFVRDDSSALYLRYSLNKTASPSNPYQNYLIAVEGDPAAPYIDLTTTTAPFMRMASEKVNAGHGALSPSRSFFAETPNSGPVRDEFRKIIRDYRNPALGRSYVMNAKIWENDHMDWAVDDGFFVVWAEDNGTPIYRVETALSPDDELQATNVHRVVASKGCGTSYSSDVYTSTSPDGTKILYAAGMLSGVACSADDGRMKSTLDLYMAIFERPRPPASLSLTMDGPNARLSWRPSTRGKLNHPDSASPAPLARETAGYHVYRGTASGRGYVRVTGQPIPQAFDSDVPVTWEDPAPPANAHYVVTAIDHAGVEGRVFSPEAAIVWGNDVRVFWEAEEGALTPPMRSVFLPAETSAGFAIARAHRAPDWRLSVGDARVTWRVEVPLASTYQLWIRARTRSAVAAATVVIDSGPALGLSATTTGWTWIQVGAGIGLTAGGHQLELVTASSDLEIDKLLLTTTTPSLEGFGNTPWFDTSSAVAWAGTPSEVKSMCGYLSYHDTLAVHDLSAYDSQKSRMTGHVVFLAWQPFAGPVHHYQVYRASSGDPSPTQAFLVGSPSKPGFVDPNLPAGTYKYIVQAVDAWGQASESSTVQTVVVP